MSVRIFFFSLLLSLMVIAQPVTFEMKNYEKIYNGKNGNKDSLFVFKITYPEFKGIAGNSAIADKMNQSIAMLIMGQKEGENLDVQFNEMVQMLAEIEDSSFFFGSWSFTTEISPKLISDDVLSFLFFHDEFLGGAHPNYYCGGINFVAKTGAEIAFDDIFVPKARAELNKMAEKIVRLEREIPADQTLTDYGYWFENDKFELNDNFVITSDNITFSFNPYEVGPYALGMTEINLPFSKIKHLIKSDGPLAWANRH